jgi:hypothetical protein
MGQTTTMLATPRPWLRVRERWRSGRSLHLVVPAALTAWFAFRAGGFFPGTVGISVAALAVALMLRVTLARAPFAGWSPLAAVVAGAGVAYGGWTVLSVIWSDAPGRALLELDRTMAYLLLFGLMAIVPRRRGDLAVMLRWVLLAAVAAALAGLATRLLPSTFDWVHGIEPARLAYPLTYWNAMSVFCALGAVLALSAGSAGDSPRWVLALGAAALPILVVAGYFPLSRGGIAAAIVGIVAYAALARPPRLIALGLTAGPPTVVALAVAYRSAALSTPRYFAGAGPAEGRHVALVLLVCCVVAAVARFAVWPLDRRLDAALGRGLRRRTVAGIGVAVVLVFAGVGVALGAPHWVRSTYDGFVRGNVVDPGADVRQRLGAAGNNGRLAVWRVALDTFESQPLRGTGAGTYELAWQRARPSPLKVIDGHSLYLETLAELGVVGLVFVLTFVGGIVFALARRLGSPERHAFAAALAAGAALLLHAGIDWDWEMPAMFAWLFAAGGIACARPEPAGDAVAADGPPRLTRVLAGLACLVLAVTPVLVAVSDTALNRSDTAFANGDCGGAIDAALDSIDALSVRPQPYETIAYCDMRAGQWGLALQQMQAARSRDPGSWRYAYGLSIAQALAGRDPRAELAVARRLNPLAGEAAALQKAYARASGPAGWRRAAGRARLPQ